MILPHSLRNIASRVSRGVRGHLLRSADYINLLHSVTGHEYLSDIKEEYRSFLKITLLHWY